MEQKAWLLTVNMGYGHQRTAYPLKNIAFGGEAINANDYEGIPEKDLKIWENMRKFYEFISDFKKIPLIGEWTFSLFDQFQKIFSFYPKKDLSKPNFQLKQIFALIKMGWGKNLVDKLKSNPLPLVSSFFTPVFMAEYFNYPGEIFCIICDADISRTWVPLSPARSKIKYFAPNERVVERLRLYGVKNENIFLTGYPLPMENIGSENLEILKENLRHRIVNLDPTSKYINRYRSVVELYLGKLPEKSNHPLTLMFSVGGAGAQKEIGIEVLKSLTKKIKNKEIKIIFSAGIKEEVKNYFIDNIEKLGMKEELNRQIEILYQTNMSDYFRSFNLALRKTDILWTKPSELSFYSALGLPIIIAPTIGAQEMFNRRWLLKSGFGNSQEDPVYTKQWLYDWLKEGYLAESAVESFIEGKKLGTLNIISKCFG